MSVHNIRTTVRARLTFVRVRACTDLLLVIDMSLMSLSLKFCNDPSIAGGDIQLFVTM